MIWFQIALAFVGLNVVTYFYFWLDKRRAETGGWRVSESILLFLSFVGGSPAAFFARNKLRHKTRKEPFSTQLQLIGMLQIGVAAGLALFSLM